MTERGKKVVADYIPAGSPESRSPDSTDENMSAVDLGLDFSLNVPVVLADPAEQ